MIKPYFTQLYKKEISTIAKKYKMSVEEVTNIYYKQFYLVIDKIRKDYLLPIEERQSIKLKGLGTIVFHPKIANKIQHGISQIETSPEDGDRN